MSSLLLPVSPNEHILGSKKAPVCVVEYGDYECPYSGRAYYIVKKIQEDFESTLGIVFRNFPLSQIHPHAPHAALATEAAGLQNKFWEMHDALFENQHELKDPDLIHYANLLELNIEQFNRDMNSDKVKEKVHQDFMSGIRSGVNGIPSFFINGLRHDGSYEYEVLFAALRKAARE